MCLATSGSFLFQHFVVTVSVCETQKTTVSWDTCEKVACVGNCNDRSVDALNCVTDAADAEIRL